MVPEQTRQVLLLYTLAHIHAICSDNYPMISPAALRSVGLISSCWCRACRTKLKQTEVDCEYLKRCCEALTEENRRLHKELAELRAQRQPHAESADHYCAPSCMWRA